MYNVGIALGLSILSGIVVGVPFGWKAAIIPALMVFGVGLVLLMRRTAKRVEAELQPLMGLLQNRKIDEGRAALEAVKARWGKWQPMLEGQLDAQIGMIDYLQLRFDEAKPRLEKGSWRNWTALTALGCIAWRKNDREGAFKYLGEAANAAENEPLVFVVWATLLDRAERREEAIKALDRGLKANASSTVLKDLHTTISNKRKVDTRSFPQTWYQFFPEDAQGLQAQMVMRGRRDGASAPPPGPPVPPEKMNRKMRRTRS